MIIPAILETDFEKILEEIKAIESVADLIQIDVCDGNFVNEETFTDIQQLDEIDTKADFELHLMVENPTEFLTTKLKKVKKVSAHVEAQNIGTFIDKAKTLGYETGISINPETNLEELAPYMERVDFIQFLTVVPGKQGSDFREDVIDKIIIFKQSAPTKKIQVDGGIDEETLVRVIEAGVEDIAIGSQIFQKPQDSFEHFVEKAEEAEEETHTQDKPIKKIAFLGGAAWVEGDEAYDLAYETAKLLAKKDYEIVNGGGPGVMRAATLGAQDSRGKVLAVTYYPTHKHKNYEGRDPENTFDEEVITMDYFDRTKVMLQNSDVHIVFKGGTGTISEFGMTWASSRIHEGHHKPIILMGKYWNHIIEEFKTHMLMRSGEVELVKIVETPKEAVDYIESLKK
jgi:ribulose-phosphate 3-epimerase